MNDEKQKRRSGWYWWALLLPVIYVLSYAPVVKVYFELETAGYNVEWFEAPIVIIYAPLDWAWGNIEPAGQFFDWYMYDFWQLD